MEYWTKHPVNEAVVDFKGEFHDASVRFDGCIHLYEYETSDKDDNEAEYIHICHLDGYIEKLVELRDAARAHFGEGWGR